MTKPWPKLLIGEQHILSHVQTNPGTTRHEIGLRFGLPHQTLSRQINDLIKDGWLQGGKRLSSNRRGPPSQSLAIVPDRLFSLGVSIMADAVTVMLVDLAGNECGYRAYRPASMSRAAVIDAATAGFLELTQATGVAPDDVPGIGIAVTGYLSSGQTFNTPRSLDEWAGVDVAAIFSEHFGRTAWADNDANLAAVGESRVGVGRWARNFAYLSFGIGFGGGVIVDGALLSGRDGNAGEFGMMLQPGFHLSPSLEVLRQTMAQHGCGFADLETLLENFEVDAPGVAEWVGKVADSLSYVCAACMAVLDPDAIVLGGRLPKALAEMLIGRIAMPETRRRGTSRDPVAIVPAEAPRDAAALGAAMMPLQMCIFGHARRRGDRSVRLNPSGDPAGL